jgi:putative transcriptional regulator
MSRRHPGRHLAPDELLLDYASGALAEGPALAVALHAALEPAAARQLDRLASLGGALFEGEGDGLLAEASDGELAQAMTRIAGTAVDPRAEAPALPTKFVRAGFEWAPPPLHRYLRQDMSWQSKFGGFEEMPLDGIRGHRVSLLRLRPGRGLPVHGHTGDEFTVVLQGGYTDATGNYGPGDLAVGPAGEHQPVADAGEPCIALIVLENPIVLTGPLGRFLNPLVRRGII